VKRRRFFADTAPLQSTDFRRLWASGSVTTFGASLTIFAVPVQVYALTQNSAYVGLSGVFALAWGVAVTGFGLVSGVAHGRAGLLLWASLGCLAVGGAADMVSAAFRSTILQQAASDDLRGRLQGVFVVVVAGGPRLADAAHGAAAAIFGTVAAVVGGGVLVVVGVLIAALAAPAFTRYRVQKQPRQTSPDAGPSQRGSA